jgi:hypothetical protein
MARDEFRFQSHVFSGTIIVQARFLGPSLFLDLPDLRAAKPIARFGDAFVFRGSYDIGPLLSGDRAYYARVALFAEKPDHAPKDTIFHRDLEEQVRRVASSQPLSQVPELRDPSLE